MDGGMTKLTDAAGKQLHKSREGAAHGPKDISCTTLEDYMLSGINVLKPVVEVKIDISNHI